jgi:hypothetical protein
VTARQSASARHAAKSRLACGHYVTAGSTIVRLDGAWHCRDCALLHTRILMQPPRPQRRHPTDEKTAP